MIEIVELKKITRQIRGVSYKPEDLATSLKEGYVTLLRATNILNGQVTNLNDVVFVSQNKVNKSQYLQAGDILVAASSGSIEVVGKSAIVEEPFLMTFGAFCKVIRPKKELVNPKYVGFFFQTEYYKKRISFLAQGANISNLKNEHIDNLEIPLPDLETQTKIVTILEKSKSILNKREKTLAQFDELLRANFLDMFGYPMERPNKWKIQPIDLGILNISAGTSYGGDEKRELKKDELGVLKVSAVTKGFFNPNEFKAVKKEQILKKLLFPQQGDLLFSRANTLELVGATCIVDADYNNLFLPDKIWKVETDESILKKVYLHYVLQNKDVRKTFLSIATGSSGSMLNISMGKFRNILIPYPPIELQKEFEDTYFKYVTLKNKAQRHLESAQYLFKSLSQLSFKGELKFGSSIDLEVLLENDYDFFKKNINLKSIRLLIERLDKNELNEKKFSQKDMYDKAKGFVFELLKEEKVKQVYDEKTKSVILTEK